MRGLFNEDLKTFKGEPAFNFPEIPCYEGFVDGSVAWHDFDVAVHYRMAAGGIHFYVDDYKFERLWNNPPKYLDLLRRFDYVVMPDFSTYFDFPVALQIYNKYRNHWLASYLCENGVRVIPSVTRSMPDNFDWILLGFPLRSVVAFSDIGVSRSSFCRDVILQNYDRMVEVLEPRQVLYFTRTPNGVPSGVTVIEVDYFRR